MLREFLCLQTLLGRLLVIAPALALFLAPLGLGISSHAPAFPWWLPSALPLAAFVAIVGWVALSLVGVWPAATTPWALTPTRLWLDSCCLCNDTPQTIAAGVAGFERFLGASGSSARARIAQPSRSARTTRACESAAAYAPDARDRSGRAHLARVL